MQTLPQSSATPPAVPASGNADPHRTADRVYEGLTIAAMLLLLVSLWVF
jgi:hypothetical protein